MTGDASLILAHQLIAAKLNILNGADGSTISSAIARADAILATFSGDLPYRVDPFSSTGQEMVQLGAALDRYNNTCEGSRDGSGSPSADNCPTLNNPTQDDSDGDALGNACEGLLYETDASNGDTDGDGCPDGRESRYLTYSAQSGGERDPLSPWDFYDVPLPALTTARPAGARNHVVTLADVLGVLAYVGTSEGGGATPDGLRYDSDLNGNGVQDGREYDRSPSYNLLKPWRSEGPDGAVTLQDVTVALKQVGDSCLAPP